MCRLLVSNAIITGSHLLMGESLMSGSSKIAIEDKWARTSFLDRWVSHFQDGDDFLTFRTFGIRLYRHISTLNCL